MDTDGQVAKFNNEVCLHGHQPVAIAVSRLDIDRKASASRGWKPFDVQFGT